MDGSLGHFKDILQRRRARKEKSEGKFDKKKLDYKISGTKTEFNFPILSKSKTDKLKQKIKRDIKKKQIIEYISFLTLIIALSVLFYYLVN